MCVSVRACEGGLRVQCDSACKCNLGSVSQRRTESIHVVAASLRTLHLLTLVHRGQACLSATEDGRLQCEIELRNASGFNLDWHRNVRRKQTGIFAGTEGRRPGHVGAVGCC